MEMTSSFLIHDVARLIRYRFDAKARTLGVTRPQWRLLLMLARFPGASQAVLADQLDVEQITLCRMIDRMQEAELLERRPDPADRRIRRIFLTPKGEEFSGRLQTIGADFQDDLLSALAPGEDQQLQQILLKLRDALSKRSDSLSASA